MDDGLLTDGLGRTIDFTHSIIIMTSNVGARDLQRSSLGFSTGTQADAQDARKAKVHKEVEKKFRPEFINRIDDILAGVEFFTEDKGLHCKVTATEAHDDAQPHGVYTF